MKRNFHVLIYYRNIAIDMGATKSEVFTERQNRMAKMMKALAHPARIAILQELVKTNACVCGELVNDLGLAQATISQHLKELKEAGLIKGNIEGTRICYCINPKVWKQASKEIELFFSMYRENGECC